MGESKEISKTDDSAKKFIMDSLNGCETHGFDHDSIYYVGGRHYLFEYLKCDSLYMTPHTSHPRNYAWNWKKFYSLWQTAQRLDAHLMLVNYSDREGDYDQVKLMYVEAFDYDALCGYLESGDRKAKCDYLIVREFQLTRRQYGDYLIRLNDLATLDISHIKNARFQNKLQALGYGHSKTEQIILPKGH